MTAPSAPGTRPDFDHVSVEDVSRHFGRRRALSHLSCVARSGTILGLLGPNGAGKSTMLAVLASLLRPTSGVIRYGSLDPSAGATSGARAAVRGRIGVVGHDLFLYPELSAHENLTFFAGLYDVARPGEASLAALRSAGLEDRANDPVSAYSRGMRQRVALERALIHDPRLVLLDEPFTGLDDASASGFLGRLRELRKDGAIIVLATHDLDLADGLLDHAIFLREGRAVESQAKPDGLRATYRSVMGPRS